MVAIGDVVEVIDESIKGKVTKITAQGVCVETTEGLLLTFSPQELVKIDENASLHYHRMTGITPKEEKNTKTATLKGKKTKKKVAPAMEVDLHIEKLVATPRGMTNYDILTTQIEEAKHQLEFAIKRGIPRIVFIHGVGEGVLKAELETLFARYSNLIYQDADYARYGIGLQKCFCKLYFKKENNDNKRKIIITS